MASELAATDSISRSTILLAFALLLWTSGFDILYATQDTKIDKAQGLCSIPEHFGGDVAVQISRVLFILTCLILVIIGLMAEQHLIYYLGVFIVAVLLSYEQYIVKDITGDQSSKNIDKAFFNVNASVSVSYLFFTALSKLMS